MFVLQTPLVIIISIIICFRVTFKGILLSKPLTRMKLFLYKQLEDLKVLRRSPDLLNTFKTGQGQLQLIMKHILFYHNMRVAAILVQ